MKNETYVMKTINNFNFKLTDLEIIDKLIEIEDKWICDDDLECMVSGFIEMKLINMDKYSLLKKINVMDNLKANTPNIREFCRPLWIKLIHRYGRRQFETLSSYTDRYILESDKWNNVPNENIANMITDGWYVYSAEYDGAAYVKTKEAALELFKNRVMGTEVYLSVGYTMNGCYGSVDILTNYFKDSRILQETK